MIKWLEIAVMKWAIFFIKRGWGADCEEEDEHWYWEGGCQSCMAKRVVSFLERHIEYTKED